MKLTKSQIQRKPASKEDCGCCDIQIDITNQGDLNIYNCSKPGDNPTSQCPPAENPPIGGCIPVALGSKHKKSLEAKLRPLLEKAKVPSVLAGSFFRFARRFLNGHSPANTLESKVFAILENLSPELQNLLSCSLRMFDGLPKEDKHKLIAPEFATNSDAPISPELLANLVAEELLERTSLEAFGDPRAIRNERPGKIRLFEPGDVSPSQVRIWKVNGLRTTYYSPTLSLGDYRPEELQQVCTPQEVDGAIVLNCEVQTENCPGHQVGGTCLKVPDVVAGEAVVLEGINFFSTDAKVRITAEPPGQYTADVDAHVYGDVDTPLTETMNGQENLILDSRVKDLITFRPPEDLGPGIYTIQVVVPNDINHPSFGDELVSGRLYINICPPASARFQIATERLEAIKETAPAWWGADEVGIRIITIPFSPSLELGEMKEHNFRYGDVDSGETRDMNRVLFQESNTGGLAFSILGYEIDGEDAYEQQIDNFTDAYIEILKEEWEFIAGLVSAEEAFRLLKSTGLKGLIVLAIAVAVTMIINIFIALWAPADLIIEDAGGLTAKDLAALTSANFPPPPTEAFTSNGDIDVKIEGLEKGAAQYRERREYRSSEEDSEYHIMLRYNRLA